ncbi:MAG: NADH-quinone oxidoreductase subunit M [Myxococcales bacterium]|nr:NADH-quinone oxidoreductase subunit M [Myxococcales bacterium]
MGLEQIPSHFPILTLVTFLPLAGALAMLVIPKANEGVLKGFALGTTTLTFVASLFILRKFDPSLGGIQAQLADYASWLKFFQIRYFLGIDGISLWLVMLTTFLGPIVILSSYTAIKQRLKEFLIALLVLQTGMLGAFTALDLFLFYIFWELMLIPMYLLIGIWGGKDRIYATVKFFIYTMAGSVLMLVGILYLYVKFGGETFLLPDLIKKAGELSVVEQTWLFIGFGIAFAIKVPLFPFHTWLPDAHTEAPTAGSVVLAGVLLKLGTYGFVRFGMPLFPDALRMLAPVIMALSVWGIIYGAAISWVQKDVKRLVAYSSVSHLGFVMVGVAAMTEEALTGAILQMVNHGICTGGLFIAIGFLYEQRHTRLIEDFGGLAKQIPKFAVFLMILTLGSIGLPGTNGFIGEFLIIAGTFQGTFTPRAPVIGRPGDFVDMAQPFAHGLFGSDGGMSVFTFKIISGVAGGLAALGVLLGAIYMLSMYRRVMFGPLRSRANRELRDLNLRDMFVAVPLVLLVFWIGLYPNFFIGKMRKSVSELTEYVRPEVRRRADSLDPGLLRRTLCADLSGKCPAECNPVNPSKACIKKGIKHRVPRVTMRTLHMMVDAERSHRRIRLPLRLELPKALRTTRTTRKGGK